MSDPTEKARGGEPFRPGTACDALLTLGFGIRDKLTLPPPRLLAPPTQPPPPRDALNENHDALECKKQGFFVAGFETPGQYRVLHDEYIPLSRAICCRPCITEADVAAIAGVVGDKNFSANDVVAVSADCRASVARTSASPNARSDAGVAADGPTCPGDTFLQGFAKDVVGNPSASNAERYFYPTGNAQCCAPRLLLRSGQEIQTERCECTRQTSQYAVGCGAKNIPESAEQAGSLVYSFDNEVSAMSAGGGVVRVPVTPLSCCKVCVSANAKPATETCASLDFCNGRGACVADGHCSCDTGWAGDACETSVGGGDGNKTPFNLFNFSAATKIACAFVFGGFLWFPMARLFGWDRSRRRRTADLHEELLDVVQPGDRVNEWEFEASDLSTSDEEDGDGAETASATSARSDEEAGEGAERDGAERDESDAESSGDGPNTPDENERDAPGEVREGETGDVDAAAEKPGTETGPAPEPETETRGKDASGGFPTECNVCMSAPVQVVLIPCGHACMCRKCSRRMRRCPVCRTEVERRQKLYLAAP